MHRIEKIQPLPRGWYPCYGSYSSRPHLPLDLLRRHRRAAPFSSAALRVGFVLYRANEFARVKAYRDGHI